MVCLAGGGCALGGVLVAQVGQGALAVGGLGAVAGHGLYPAGGVAGVLDGVLGEWTAHDDGAVVVDDQPSPGPVRADLDAQGGKLGQG